MANTGDGKYPNHGGWLKGRGRGRGRGRGISALLKTNNSYNIWKDWFFNASGVTHYTLTCEVGVFNLTGNPPTLKTDRRLIAEMGVYVLTGNDANLKADRKLITEPGVFVLTMNDVGVKADRKLVAEVGEFLLQGNDVGLRADRKLLIETGVYNTTFNPADLIYSGGGGGYEMVIRKGGVWEHVADVNLITP